MNKPDTTTQRSIIEAAIKAIESECYSLTLSGEAMRTIGLVEKATELGEQLAKSMKLHAFYSAKLNELA
ncbi:MAG: hypothetical protein B7Z37_16890 [Verrucomicrobia bacterium 12-59-8]|nr:MAG: hypothetical protein B7Z37_16890 [Verrucomicrobia bacterium 12-59-8]